jgi:hypothetical protein
MIADHAVTPAALCIGSGVPFSCSALVISRGTRAGGRRVNGLFPARVAASGGRAFDALITPFPRSVSSNADCPEFLPPGHKDTKALHYEALHGFVSLWLSERH